MTIQTEKKPTSTTWPYNSVESDTVRLTVAPVTGVSGGYIDVKKVGDRVFINAAIFQTSDAGEITVGQLPSSIYYPREGSEVATGAYNATGSNTDARLYVYNNGSIIFETGSSSEACLFSFSYLTATV